MAAILWGRLWIVKVGEAGHFSNKPREESQSTVVANAGKSISCLDRIFYFGLLWAETIPTRYFIFCRKSPGPVQPFLRLPEC